ncbi:MAG: ATP-binding protein [Pyrinomonadaceae bacterium]|nr:ATP-binding protein [Pyrinomonadaceae bacterium]
MDPLERKFTLHVPSSTKNLMMIREFVSNICAQAGLNEADTGKVELSVDEACANVIEHAYSHDTSKEVIIRATFDNKDLRIDVEDTGLGFDPSSIQQAEVERLVAERKSGGLGMRLITSFMDEVRYEFEPGQKNVLHMMKRISKK